MSFAKVAQNLSKATYGRLRESLQLGKWPDGRSLSREQQEICMAAVITYEAANNVPESERIGYLNRDRPTLCGGSGGSHFNDGNAADGQGSDDSGSWSVLRSPDAG